MIIENLQSEKRKKIQQLINIPETDMSIPVTYIQGKEDGPCVLVLSGIHGGEYVGIQTAIELAAELQPEDINGSLIVVHPANVKAFLKRISYVNPEDNKNLNRAFPGSKEGSATEKLAYFITEEFIKKADYMIDLHGGDLHEALTPYIVLSGSEDPSVNKESEEAARLMGINLFAKVNMDNTTFGYGIKLGIPGFLVELGNLGLWSENEVKRYKEGLINVFRHWGLVSGTAILPSEEAIMISDYQTEFSPVQGCWYSFVKPGQKVDAGDDIGEIRDYFGNTISKYKSMGNGIVLYTVGSLAVNNEDPIFAVGIL